MALLLGAVCVARLIVSDAGSAVVNGVYRARGPEVIPAAFGLVCRQSRWNEQTMWTKLNGAGSWWEADNGSYIYLNRGDGQWWMDSGVTGLGLYINTARADDVGTCPPLQGRRIMGDGQSPVPTLRIDA